jgi:hypothetical protein
MSYFEYLQHTKDFSNFYEGNKTEIYIHHCHTLLLFSKNKNHVNKLHEKFKNGTWNGDTLISNSNVHMPTMWAEVTEVLRFARFSTL